MLQVVHNIKKHKSFNFALVIMWLMPLAVISVISASPAHADNLDYSINVDTSLNVTVSSETVSLTLNPSTNPFDSTNVNVLVGTNNPWGYKLYLKANSTDLTNSTYSTPAYINTLSDTATGTTEDFPVNKWGYRVSALSSGNTADSSITDTTGTYFYPFVSDTLIGSATTSVNNSISTLTFASKVDYERPAGTYTLDFSFRTVPTVTTLDMQNLDPTVCASAPTLVTDSRDGQMYAIARLADGKCWMLQNLKLGKLSDNIALSPANSNVSDSGFILTNKRDVSTRPVMPKESVVVDGETVADQYNESAYACTDDYGCYYNWYTATAGSGTSWVTSGNAAYSICPTGWRLPTSGSSGEYRELAIGYGYLIDSGTAVSAKMTIANPDTNTENINGQYLPGFLFSGHYNAASSYAVGTNGDYWSSTTYSAQYPFYFDISNSGAYPSERYIGKYAGLPIRCLLQES